MLTATFLSLSLFSQAYAAEQTVAIYKRNLKVAWRTFNVKRSTKVVLSVSASEGYSFVLSDNTNCFSVSKDALATFAEKKDQKGILVLWRTGAREFLPVNGYVESVSFFQMNRTLGVALDNGHGGIQTTLYRAQKNLPLFAKVSGQVLECSQNSAIISASGRAEARPIGDFQQGTLESKRLDRFLETRNLAAIKRSGAVNQPNSPSQLRVSLNAKYMLDTRFDSSNSFEAVPLSCITALFGASGQEWEWHTDVEPDEIFFADNEHLVFNIQEPFKMGAPGKIQKYGPGIYYLNCRTKALARSPLDRAFVHSGLPAGTLVFHSI